MDLAVHYHLIILIIQVHRTTQVLRPFLTRRADQNARAPTRAQTGTPIIMDVSHHVGGRMTTLRRAV